MTGDSFVLAASSEMLFVDLPKPERIRRLHDAGFAVEIWDWRGHDIDVLERLAGEGVVFTSMTGYTEGVYVLENLNTAVDHPGTPFARAADTLDLVRGIDSPHLKLNLDLYHAQIGEGNLIDLCREALPWIGEIQVADVPGRCEPGTGEVNYANVAIALRDMGYAAVVGLEAFASGDPDEALAAFRAAFTP